MAARKQERIPALFERLNKSGRTPAKSLGQLFGRRMNRWTAGLKKRDWMVLCCGFVAIGLTASSYCLYHAIGARTVSHVGAFHSVLIDSARSPPVSLEKPVRPFADPMCPQDTARQVNRPVKGAGSGAKEESKEQKKEEMNKEIKVQKMRFYLLVPLIVVPIASIALWLLEGGEQLVAGTTSEDKMVTEVSDSTESENPKIKTKKESYQQADQKKKQLAAENREDTEPSGATHEPRDGAMPHDDALLLQETYATGAAFDEQTALLIERMEQLMAQLNRQPSMDQARSPANTGITPSVYARSESATDYGSTERELARLETMMASFAQPQQEDLEGQQMNEMLDKILDIQHPQRVDERLAQLRQQKFSASYPVTAVQQEVPIVQLGGSPSSRATGGFYGLDDDPGDDEEGNAIRAVIHSDQTVVNGAVVKLRLIESIRVGELEIPKDSFVFGVAQLQDERLEIQIQHIRFQDHILPVALKVFDLDGLSGIHIPGAITRDAAQQSADRTVQMMRLSSLDASLVGQAASAGMEAAKNLIGKKVRLTKVNVQAGYQVLLRDEKEMAGLASRSDRELADGFLKKPIL